MNSKFIVFIAVSGFVAGSSAVAQTAAQIAWQVSLDNGSTWQGGSITAPQTQASVIVRAQVTVFDNGVPFLTQNRARFAQAGIEAYVHSSTVRADQASTVQVLVPALPAALFDRPFSTSQHGLTYKIDGFNDFLAPGQGSFLLSANVTTPTGSSPSSANPITVLRYRLTLDGTFGDRRFDGGLLGFTGVGFQPTLLVGANQVAVYAPSGPLTASAVDVTQLPATLTVIPAPGAAALSLLACVFAARRRRERCVLRT